VKNNFQHTRNYKSKHEKSMKKNNFDSTLQKTAL